MTHRLQTPDAFPFSEDRSTPLAAPLAFTLRRDTGRFTIDAAHAELLGLSRSPDACGMEELAACFLDKCDEELCRTHVRGLMEGGLRSFHQYGRMNICGEVYWVRLEAQAASAHVSCKRIKGTLDVFNFRRIFAELLRASDYASADRRTLAALAGVPLHAQAARLAFTRLPLEPDLVCAKLKESSETIIFAEPLDDGSVLVCFTSRAAFDEAVRTIVDAGDIDGAGTFHSGVPESYDDAVMRRAAFLRRLSDSINAQCAFTLSHVVDMTIACRSNFSGFHLLFQPQACRTGFAGGEFLVRIAHADKSGLPGPDVFVPVLEKTPLMTPFGRWTVEACLEETQRIKAACRQVLPPGFAASLNISACQADDEGFVPFVRDALARFGIPPRHLLIELTETAPIEAFEALQRQLEALRRLGLQTAIDDFGNGYNSIDILLRLPFDRVKFSNDLIATALSSEPRRRFLAKLIDACHELGAEVCAEGVETADMHQALQALGADLFQGYYFARPQPVAEAVKLVLQTSSFGCAQA